MSDRFVEKLSASLASLERERSGPKVARGDRRRAFASILSTSEVDKEVDNLGFDAVCLLYRYVTAK